MRFSRLRNAVLAGVLAGLLAGPGWAEAPRQPRGAPIMREITVVNRTRQPIYQLRISPSDADQWGDDRLGDDSIAPGGSLRVRLGRTRDCLFDVQIIYEDAGREERRAVDVCRIRTVAFDGSTTMMPPVPFAFEHVIGLENATQRTIRQIFVSPDSADQWGEDLASTSGIAPQQRDEVRYRGGCMADLRVVFDNRAAEERRGVDICGMPVLVIRPGWTSEETPPVPPRSVPGVGEVAILNGTGGVVTELYLRPEDGPGDGEADVDVLGNAVLPTGARLVVPYPHGTSCRFTARIGHGGDRGEHIQIGIDLCRSSTVTLEPARRG